MSVARPASAADVAAAWDDPKLANVLYHDWEADHYDQKWSIDFDQRCIDYARDRFVAVAGTAGWPYRRALELGCGTGFFLLNLKQAGVLDQGFVTDLSPGMVTAASRNAAKLGFAVSGRVADAESIPYPDASFDLVVGHAVLHHIPDVELAFREVLRVLEPGGRFVFAGEPTRWGDAIARRLSRATWALTTRLTRFPGLASRWSRPQVELDESSRAAALEAVVDLHTFDPAALAGLARAAGAVGVDTVTEELTAAWFGWPVRTFEAAVNPDRLGWNWAMFAYRSWQQLSALDRALARVVPARFYYNVLITGRKPGASVKDPSTKPGRIPGMPGISGRWSAVGTRILPALDSTGIGYLRWRVHAHSRTTGTPAESPERAVGDQAPGLVAISPAALPAVRGAPAAEPRGDHRRVRVPGPGR